MADEKKAKKGQMTEKKKDIKKIIFLDRDGVINQDVNGYVTSWKDFKFIPESIKALKILADEGFDINIISNQAGVAKGLMKKRDLDAITKSMIAEFKKKGIDRVHTFYCTHQTSDNCYCRKPKAGLLMMAVKGKKINFRNTFFIGDNSRDIITGKTVGCKTILVLSGKTKKPDLKNLSVKPDFITKDLFTAVRKIVNQWKMS